MKPVNLTKLERLADFIQEYAFENNGDMPGLSQIMEELHLSKATAYRYLVLLNEKGVVSYNGKGTLDLKDKNNSQKKYRSIRIPIFGTIICGTPEEEEQYNEGYLAVPEEWVDGDCFLLRARGDSMADVGVAPGDLVLVKKANTALDGQIVVALTEDGNTLKRLCYEGNTPVLHAENRTYPAEKRIIRPQKLEIQGIATKIIKDIR